MRLAYLSGSQLPSPFANSVHVVKMCRAFADAGWSVTLYGRASTSSPHLTAGQHPLTSYGVPHTFELALSRPPAGRLIQSLALAWTTRQRLTEHTPDLLYARHVWSLIAAASLGVPFVYEAHAMPPNAVHRAAEQWLFRHPGFRRLVVISGALRDDYLSAFPTLDPSRVLVAHDGADALAADAVAADLVGDHGSQARLASARRGALQVGYVGHLYPGKGMEIVAALAPRMAHVDFHVVGGTPADLTRWRHAASYDNLTYHGFQPHAELGAYYAAFDVLLIPVQTRVALQGGKGEIGRWTSPLKLFEAMSWGKALVVSDHPTLREVVTHEHDALIANPTDVTAWQQAIDRLERDHLLRAQLGANARATLERSYTWHERARAVTTGLAA